MRETVPLATRYGSPRHLREFVFDLRMNSDGEFNRRFPQFFRRFPEGIFGRGLELGVSQRVS